PLTLFQIQTKFRDEIRPRFGVMRAREFVMKDAYSFHLDQASLDATYQVMYDAYARIFTRLGLKFRAVQADSGDIGGDISHEFQVLAESGEDAIAFSDQSDYAANMEMAEALAPSGERPKPSEDCREMPTPGKTSCEEVAEFLNVPLTKTVKAIAVVGSGGFALVLVRGDHEVNETKLRKIPGFENHRLATEDEIKDHLGCRPGYIGPAYLNLSKDIATGRTLYNRTSDKAEPIPFRPFTIIVDRTVNQMADFVCGANKDGFHCRGFNLDRDVKPGYAVADIRNVVEGDLSPDGKGTLRIARGIEVGHIFQNGRKYTEAMHVGVLDEQGKLQTPLTGCYGIGVSRIVAAAIEQNHDEHGIIWPEPLAPFQIALLPLNMHKSPQLQAAADEIYRELVAAGCDVLMDDRELRPGPMFADMELIGIPHRLVLSDRGLGAGTVEYKGRRDAQPQDVARMNLLPFLKARLQAST
ncbi:MAG: proline--tRNA ligase, partial [Gammaproteobacteria bacterium]